MEFLIRCKLNSTMWNLLRKLNQNQSQPKMKQWLTIPFVTSFIDNWCFSKNKTRIVTNQRKTRNNTFIECNRFFLFRYGSKGIWKFTNKQKRNIQKRRPQEWKGWINFADLISHYMVGLDEKVSEAVILWLILTSQIECVDRQTWKYHKKDKS